MKKILLLSALTSITTLTGCVSTNNIVPQYINPNNYSGYDCTYLQSEVARITKLAEKPKINKHHYQQQAWVLVLQVVVVASILVLALV